MGKAVLMGQVAEGQKSAAARLKEVELGQRS